MRPQLLTVVVLGLLVGWGAPTDASHFPSGSPPRNHGDHFVGLFFDPAPAIGIDATTSGGGYSTIDIEGELETHGDARDQGDLLDLRAQGRIGDAFATDIRRTTDGTGYWITDLAGGVHAFGNARYFGSIPERGVISDTLGMAPTPDGNGYWLLDTVGGIHSFGTAGFFGSLPGRGFAVPVVAMAATPDGQGYWVLDHVGGVHAFGSAQFLGSLPGRGVAAEVTDIVSFPGAAQGYWVLDHVGGVHAFGSAPFFGSPVGTTDGAPAIDMAATPHANGYWVMFLDGTVVNFPGGGGAHACDDSYPDICVAPPPPDLNCSDIPYRNFRVFSDPHVFDTDRDFVGCETAGG